MTDTTRPDYLAMARETVGDLEEKRGLVAAELEACETELAGLRGEAPYSGGDGYLRWDAKREVWVGSDGFAHDGAGLRNYSRGGAAPGGGA